VTFVHARDRAERKVESAGRTGLRQGKVSELRWAGYPVTRTPEIFG